MLLRRIGCAAVACLVAAGCSTDEGTPERPGAERPSAERPYAQRPPGPRPEPARCPSGASNCSTASGRILYVERVDPDGDGDLHVVVAAGSITLPGMTSIDVAADLRPRRDPEIGDRVSAAGPVQPGSYKQPQIHALELHVRHR
jgi:hypothetical protein